MFARKSLQRHQYAFDASTRPDSLDELLLINALRIDRWGLGVLWLAASHGELRTTEGSGESRNGEL